MTIYLFSQFFEDKAIEKLLGTEALKFTHNIIGKE